jgi:hypothetical protein
MLLSREDAGLIRRTHLRNLHNMSLNRAEQTLFDYMESHADERHFWQDKVRDLMNNAGNDLAASAALATELGLYCEERSRAGWLSMKMITGEELRLTSFRNLAEHLMRVLGPVRPPRRSDSSGSNEFL